MYLNRSIVKKYLGFTIIELIIVIVLLAVISAIAALAWPDFSAFNLNAQAELIVSDIQHVQNLSMTHGVRYAFTRLSATSYQIATITGTNAEVKNLPNGIQFGNFNNLPNNLITFDGRGVPYVDATIPGTPLTQNARINLIANGRTVSVRVRPNSGQAYIQ